MKALEDKILAEGTVLPGNILKVGSFLNHQIDSVFMMSMGEEIARLFKDAHITKVVTIEASGIAVALAAGIALKVPMVFAKKHGTSNISGSIYTSRVHSYTHNKDYNIIIERQFIDSNDCVLLVDDFLANGQAIQGLVEIVDQAGASLAGACVAIEKGFQHGGDELRRRGIRVEALATIESMSDNSLTFRGADN
ncbi:MAG: xanthine phosphoribosyltransferase [Lachnospiraceae bacterium]|nr:xanthine phosphoribosyltransferase [Lachnospiraceae bacterium]